MLPDFAELLEPPRFSAFYDANLIFWKILDFFNKTGLRKYPESYFSFRYGWII